MTPRSLFEKVWEDHLVLAETQQHPAVLYVDLHLIHEVSSPQAFRQLRERGLNVRRPERTIATMDHSTPTLPPTPDGALPFGSEAARKQVALLEENCAEFGIELLGWDSPGRGIVHVIGPEMGVSRPGMTIVCGDSHTSTHGAFGALAFGIGTTEISHVLATQCLLQCKPQSMAVTVDGALSPGVTAKDVILGIIAEIGTGGGTGHVIEYRGTAIRSLSMEGRMTVCNMSIEAGARAGMIGPDETTFAWLKGRERAPQGADFDAAVEHWRQLRSDDDTRFDKAVSFDANTLRPMITYGTNPGMAVAVDAPVPEANDPDSRKALNYMRLEPGKPLAGTPVDVVFIGSCTNSRLSDLEQAAEILRGRQISPRVRLLVVPGSQKVKKEAEALGLHNVFMAAGGQWREAGCSMCIAMNGDMAAPGELAVSTSNRNFEGRQGKGARTILASPLTAAASAVAGAVADPRPYM